MEATADWHKHCPPFIFASSDGMKSPSTARRVHIRRLRDILHLSIQRGDLHLARRAFGLLTRCEEIEWVDMWKIGLIILAVNPPPPCDSIPGTARHIEFLRVMMLQHPEERESLVQELVLSLAMAGRERDALDELELYLPSPPYQDNAVLHTYAGFLCLRLASVADADSSRDAQGQNIDASKENLLRGAQQHLERAHALDPEGVIAPMFIHKLATLTPEDGTVPNESDDDMMEVDSKGLHRKRIRI
ncbi:hypothetical protein F5148DRAFT_165516 [Russula earlei]|uniref:Uncharacterized protein n=1 Tax=Russula earlei TaxID=71964 RepID=A0ACC0U5Q6_9AGAM|nr:hypothetical protein F5148DRAFT_165516 [Russula earlei]